MSGVDGKALDRIPKTNKVFLLEDALGIYQPTERDLTTTRQRSDSVSQRPFDSAVQYCSSNIAAEENKHNGIHFMNQYSTFLTKLSYSRQPLLVPEAGFGRL